MGGVAHGHPSPRRPVALKFLHRSGEAPESRDRFLREARAACAVHHPNVVSVLDFLTLDDDAPAIVLELLSGESLRDHLARQGPLSVPEAVALLAPVVSAVGTAHAAGIVHRDLKPENIFLHRDGPGPPTVKVLDFGVAKVMVRDALPDEAGTPTRAGDLLGTPTYMSPEQVFGEIDVDHRADIWALGIVLYECLAGRAPTAAPNVGQTFKLIVSGDIRPLKAVAADVPEALAAVVDAMLRRDRAERPADLRPVLETMQRLGAPAVPTFGPPRSAPTTPASGPPSIAGSRADADRPTRPLTGPAPPTAPSRPWPADRQPGVPAGGRRRLWAIAGAALVGATVVLWNRASDVPAPAPTTAPASLSRSPATPPTPAASVPSPPPQPPTSARAPEPAPVTPSARPTPRPPRPAASPPVPSAGAPPALDDPYGF
jgi:serine/threonine-protein kinase